MQKQKSMKGRVPPCMLMHDHDVHVHVLTMFINRHEVSIEIYETDHPVSILPHYPVMTMCLLFGASLTELNLVGE